MLEARNYACCRPPVAATAFVQQLKRQNAARARNSLFLPAQGVTRFSVIACAQNSGTIRATRPLGRGRVRAEAALGFMIDDLRFMIWRRAKQSQEAVVGSQ